MTKKSDPAMRLYLVDASSYAYRAYHATARQGLANAAGLPTGATLVFTTMLLKLMREEKPTHLATIWDARGKTFRHHRFPEYKATRAEMPGDLAPQLDYMRRIVAALNLPALELAGYEADDLIGTLARRAEAEGIATVIVTGDKDLTQLVSERVTLLDTMKDTRTDVAGVRERFGVGPERVVDLFGLMGDSSDNIPGVPQVGEKTAVKLMAQYGTLDQTLAHAGEVKGTVGQNLLAFADQARLSRELATIVTTVPIETSWPDFHIRPPDHDRLTALFRELEFSRLMHDFAVPSTAVSYDRYRLLQDPAELREFAASARAAGLVSVDTETTALDPMRAELVGISLAVEPGQAVYVPVSHTGLDAAGQMDKKAALDILRPLFADPAVKKVGQNLQYDCIVLEQAGAPLAGLHLDTMIGCYLLNPKRRANNLENLSAEYLEYKKITYGQVCGKGKKQISFAQVALEEALRYSGEDADVALRLAAKVEPALKSEGLWRLFADLEMPLLPILTAMRMRGVKVDVGRLGRLSVRFGEKAEKLRAQVYDLAGGEFNLDSPRQLGEVLFERLKLPAGKKTKTGFSTGVEVLTKLAETHELPRLVLDYRSLAKLIGTYTDALPRLVNPETGRIHTSYNQAATSTGRLSSSDPNLQNIPVRTEEGRMIREAFVGQGDNLILSADYSQVELRLMAHISEEPALVEAFARGEDIHARTAAEIFAAGGEVTPEMRRRAKTINFGILYGMSAHGLSRQLGIDHQEAQEYIDRYFARYPRVQLYMEKIVAAGRSNGYVETLLGRRLPMPELTSANHLLRQAAEREAINAPLQGSAADIVKIAMIRVERAMTAAGMRSKMIMQVHDELVFEAAPDELEAVRALAVKEMEGAFPLRVQLKVDASHGRSWAEAH
jgi:DNA polymerase-1